MIEADQQIIEECWWLTENPDYALQRPLESYFCSLVKAISKSRIQETVENTRYKGLEVALQYGDKIIYVGRDAKKSSDLFWIRDNVEFNGVEQIIDREVISHSTYREVMFVSNLGIPQNQFGNINFGLDSCEYECKEIIISRDPLAASKLLSLINIALIAHSKIPHISLIVN